MDRFTLDQTTLDNTIVIIVNCEFVITNKVIILLLKRLRCRESDKDELVDRVD